MTAKTKYSVIDSIGHVHTRTSHRVYTHIVVMRIKDSGKSGKAIWCGRLDLARKAATDRRRWYPGADKEIEIIPVSSDYL